MSPGPTAARATALCSRRSLLAGAAALAGSLAWPARADLVAVTAAARPSVLPIGTFNATDNPRFSFRGSGFVVGDGTLLATCFHVLPEGAEVESGPRIVALIRRGLERDSTVRVLRVVETDRLRDLALLRIEGDPLPALLLDDSPGAREGQAVALMGYPIGGVLGFSPVVHRGIVSSITQAKLPMQSARQLDAKTVARLREGNFELYQLDATAYPGNSGGPLLDAATGRVLGVVSSVLLKGGRESALSQPTGITYAVPVAPLRDLLKGR